MPSPMNPTLFSILQAQFGEVRTTNPGQPRITSRVPDPARPGRFTERADQRGEQYAVSCPFCGDDRCRLYISYMYGVLDPATGQRNYGLWCCHNEDCHQVEANRAMLRSRLAVPISRRYAQHVELPRHNSGHGTQPQEIILPEGLTPIAALASQPSCCHLPHLPRLRPPVPSGDVGYQLLRLVHCLSPRSHEPHPDPGLPPRKVVLVKRLRIPLSSAAGRPALCPAIEVLGGSDAKYLSAAGMQKSELLYGLHLAIASDGPVYVVEGPADAWRVGPGAIATLRQGPFADPEVALGPSFSGPPHRRHARPGCA